MRPWSDLNELVAPSRCLGCGARGPLCWCAACAEAARAPRRSCRRCAAEIGGQHRCWPADAPVTATIAALAYEGPVPRTVVRAKIGGARAGWAPLGRLLAASVVAARPEADVVAWVPTHPRRARRRGIDHARALARAVGLDTGLPVAPLLAAGHDAVRARVRLPGTSVLLVDDLLTTGRTAAGAAAALRAAGAGEVELAVLARAGRHPLVSTDQPAPPGSARVAGQVG